MGKGNGRECLGSERGGSAFAVTIWRAWIDYDMREQTR